MKPVDQYHKHMEKYEVISHKLETAKQKFERSDRETQRRLLLDSYIFATISVQTPVDIHEDAFRRIKEGEKLEDALASVNYRKNKASYIRETETKFEVIDHVINLLEKEEVNAAHKNISKNFKGVGTVKAAFTLAMLGYKNKACLDTNVLNAADIDRKQIYNGVKIEKYDRQCNAVLDKAGLELPDRLSNFMKQWIIFDAQRESFTNHNIFFESIEV